MGLQMLRRTHSWGLAMVPAGVAAVLLLLMLALGGSWMSGYLTEINASGQGFWDATLDGLRWLAGGVALLVASGIVALLGAQAVAGTILETIAHRVLKLHNIEPQSSNLNALDIALDAVRELGLFLVGMLVILLIGLIPGLGWLAAPILAPLWSAFFLGHTLTTPALEGRLPTFKERWEYALTQPLLVLGCGLVSGVLLAIPLVNLLVLPVAVAGSAWALSDRLPD